MVEFLSAWSEQIIISIIIVLIIEMIIPNSSHKKYLKIVLDLFLILVIISPLTSKINKNFSFYMVKNFIYDENIQNLEYQNIDLINGTDENFYRENIIKSIEDSLKLKGINAKVNDISLSNFLVDKITINILKESGNNIYKNKDIHINEVNLEKIDINNEDLNNKEKSNKNNKEKVSEEETNNEDELIKSYIFENYGTDINNIKIVRE